MATITVKADNLTDLKKFAASINKKKATKRKKTNRKKAARKKKKTSRKKKATKQLSLF
ncbi:MAG: hypothetical protein J6Y35_03905 [Bacteroidales bacterium]|nr:hypothetical protein [Bacteroidales bacterium]